MKIGKNQSFFGDLLKIVSGTAIAESLVIVSAPIIARLYNPEAFGLSALLFAIAGVIGVVACLRYEFAILLPRDDTEATNLLGVSLIAVAGVTVFTWIFTIFGSDLVITLLKTPELENYLYLLPLAVFFNGSFLALNLWNTRTKHFGRLSIARITSSVTTVSMQLGAGLSGYVTGGSLIIANILGSAGSVTLLSVQIWKDHGQFFKNSITAGDLIPAMKRYKKFPLYDTWSALINTISWQFPIFLLSFFFSPVIVGLYTLGFIVLQTPSRLVGIAINQVFLQRLSAADQREAISNLTDQLFEILVMIGLFPMLVITLTGADLFTVVFGIEWREAGVYAQMLSIFIFINFISEPLHGLYTVFERQEFGLKFNIANIIGRFAALFIGGILVSPRGAILLFAIAGILTYGYTSIILMNDAGISKRRIWDVCGINFLRFIPAGIMLVIFQILTEDPLVIFAAVCAILLGYYIYLLKTDRRIAIFLNDIGLFGEKSLFL